MITLPVRDIEFIKLLIPQREPVIMVDSLYEFDAVSLTGGLTIKGDSFLVENQQLQASGVMEHMAQCVAIHTGYTFYLQHLPAPTGYIGSISKMEIKLLPQVGDTLITKVSILHEFDGITMVNISCSCNGREIAQGEMKTVIKK